jgi:tRNA dimethylallyltransferase
LPFVSCSATDGEGNGDASPGVLILTGPTGSGKTILAIELAERFDAEIIGADSRQIYRGMSIVTASPTDAQRARVRHHLVGFVELNERYSAGRFVRDALSTIDDIHARGKRVIIAGGAGFYVRALTGDTILSPAFDPVVRQRLADEVRIHPPGVLGDWLRTIRPESAATDPYRVVRALEIALAERLGTVRADSVEVSENLRTRRVPYRKLYLEVSPDVLQRRIETRTDAMLQPALFEEAERIGVDSVAANAVGYREVLAYLAGWSTREELRIHFIRSTRRLAKRQATWFRTEPGLVRVPAEDALAIAAAQAGALPGWA